MMNALCLGCAVSRKMVAFVYNIRSCVSSRLLKVLCVCVPGLSPVLSPGHAHTHKAKHMFPPKCDCLNSCLSAKLPHYYIFIGLFAC